MKLRADDRGVTVQVGTVLLFAVLIVLLSTYQASVVPQQNEEVEFDHNQQVQSELQDLRDELHRTAVTGGASSSSVSLGTRYPVRAFFVNPPPAAGSLETTPAANATVVNAEATGETGDYWTGNARNFSTRGLVYNPGYNVYQNPPTTVYRGGVLYNRFEGGNRTLGGQRLVEGNAISLVALSGDYAEAGSDTASVDVRAVSPAVRTVTVENENENANVSVVVPTKRPATEWEELLEDQMDGGGNDDRYVLAVEEVPGRSAVEVVLEPATYELRLAKVGVGTDVSAPGAHYVTDVRGDNASVPENSDQQLVVEVRDRFNNPVSGATLNATLVSDLAGDRITAQGQDGDQLTDLTTDAEGRVTVGYDAPDDFDDGNEPVEVRVSTDSVPSGAGPPGGGPFAPGTRANLSFDLTAVNVDGSGLGGGGGGGGGSDAAYQTLWDRAAIDDEPGMTCYANNTCRYDRSEGSSVTLTAWTDPVAEDAVVEYAVNDTGIAWFPDDETTTGSDGRATVDLSTATTGNASVYASSGGSGDALAIDVYDSGGGGGPPNANIAWRVIDGAQNTNANYRVEYDVSGAGDWFEYVTITYDYQQNQNCCSGSNQIFDARSTGSFGHGGTEGNDYNITIRAYDANGTVLAERSLIDEVDGDDPTGDDSMADLREADSPTIANVSIADETPQNGGATFDVAYNTTHGTATYPTVEFTFRNLDNNWATETRTSDGRQGSVSYSRSGTNGNEYEIVVTVVDDDGILVDEAVYTQEADGNDET